MKSRDERETPVSSLPRARKPAASRQPESQRPLEARPVGVIAIDQLQRKAGNAAVTHLLQRLATATAGAPATTATPLWPKGPTTDRKSKTHPLKQYVDWLKDVEKAYPGRENVAQRMRRLYYSEFVGKQLAAHGGSAGPGKRFDQTISTSGKDSAPLESPPVSQAALDGLFETDSIQTPSGALVDVSHIWADVDLAASGKSTLAAGAAAGYGVDFQGVLTWTGDLASWFIEFVSVVKKKTGSNPPLAAGVNSPSGFQSLVLAEDPHALLMSLVGKKVAKDDLLGDLDAQAIVQSAVRPGRLYGGSLTNNMSGILESYYQPAAGTPAPEASRFAAFVKAAHPTIPFVVDPKAAAGIRLDSTAKDRIHSELKSTSILFLSQGTSGNTTPVMTCDFVLEDIAQQFTDFLDTGLKTGDAPWPTP